ncbi:hypothetical protein [Brucella gallinifaecis]|uniref:hypothetical protein n=1 Tax=Brucella gallinifaecis TaxID=215590 RepID=UPI0023621DB1|nr:hypothetical protein [Brucella gallinifaecis]
MSFTPSFRGALATQLPKKQLGARPADDLRMISGILHVLKGIVLVIYLTVRV